MTKKDIKKIIDDYNAGSVSKLEPLKHMFEKTSMYLGSVDNPQHTIEEAIMNSMDEVQVGVADKIWITYNEDLSISVKDNGRGIPPMYDKKFKMPVIRALLTIPNTGKAFSGSASGSSQNGVGMKATTATSDWLQVTVWRDGYEWFDKYELIDGNPGIPAIKLRKSSNGELNLPKTKAPENSLSHGTEIRWLPSDQVWDSIKFDWKEIKTLMHELCYLNPNLTVYLDNKNTNDKVTYQESGGTDAFIKEIIKTSKSKLLTPIYRFTSIYDTGDKIKNNGKEEPLLIKADVTFAWSDAPSHKSVLYTNNVPNPLGGTPVKGLYAGVSRIINKYSKDLNMSKDTIEQRDVIPGLVSIVSMVHPDPKFDGQTKKEITSNNARNALNTMVFNEVQIQFDRTIESIKTIIKNSIKRASERQKEADSKFNLKSKDVLTKISKKLSPSRRTGLQCELFIVEGDSAGGTLVDERDTDFQAILPVRGKVLNTYKASPAKSMANDELATLFGAIGTGINSDFDIKKLNYGKIIIATDSDPDGASISCLLLTAIIKYTPELIRQGYVYRVLSPFFVNTLKDKSVIYTYTNDEQYKFLAKTKSSDIVSIERNKGLGELDNDMVEETIINKETRKIMRFVLDEDNEDNTWDVVNKLMGDDTTERKNIFFNEGMYAKDLS